MHARAHHGFTLIELMIVVVVVAILAGIAWPSYLNQVRASRRADAQGALVSFASAMERYFTINGTYLGAGAGGANTGAPDGDVHADQSPIEGGTAYYDLTIQAATATTYTLRATPVNGRSNEDDGFLQITSRNVKSWDRNDNGAIDGGEDSWSKH